MILDFSQNGVTLVVEVDEKGQAYLKHFGNGACTDAREKKAKWCPLAEVHLCGESANDHHFAKHTGSYGSYSLRYVSHETVATENGNRVAILLSDGRINATVNYQFYNGIAVVRAWTEVTNAGNAPVGLEYVSSFSYTGLDDGEGEYTAQDICVGIPHNGWYREANWRFGSLPELGFDRINSFSGKRVALSNAGTWSSKEHLPMGFVSNKDSGHCWLWQIEHNGSWQWEISDIAKMLYLKVSGPTEQEHQWYKELAPGECFESVKVALTVAADFEGTVHEMTAYRRQIFTNNGENAALPVIFNDYMNCLGGDPTEEREYPMIDKAAEAGAEYYCIDAGWYAEGGWWETVGQWQPAVSRFPNGIKKVLDYIREKGMIPGLWLEIEVMGIHCPLAKEWEDECFFMRHGKRVIDHGRYQLDFRHPKVRAHANAVLDRVVREYGAGYIKMDYNIEAGVGTELGADSFGDGLLQHNRAYLSWLDEIRARYPSLVWENCSSGGMRMDYAMLSRSHLQSVSDQTKYIHNAPIAAAAPTAVLPEQAAVWSYPLGDADVDATALNMINALLQRIHLSGKITELSDEAFAVMKEGIAVYKSYRDLIPTALPIWPLGLPTQQSPWIAMGLRCADRTLLAVWRLHGEADTVQLPVSGNARVLYPSCSDAVLAARDGGFALTLPREKMAVLLEIRETV